MDTFKGLGGRKLYVSQSWINKAKGGRLGVQEVSVLLMGVMTQSRCAAGTPGKECLQEKGVGR